MPTAKKPRHPCTFGDFFKSLEAHYNCKFLRGEGGLIISRQLSIRGHECIVKEYGGDEVIEPALLQWICRRLNINSGDFGVTEIF